MKRGKVSLVRMCVLALLLSLGLASQVSANTGNILRNPTFVGAEELFPPAGWEVYGNLANGHQFSVVNPDDPQTRAVLMEDVLAVRGGEGEIGLQQTVAAGPGLYRGILRIGGLDSTDPFGPYFQVRFLPSNKNVQIRATPSSKEGFEEFIVEAEAPAGTTQIRVYLYTPDRHVMSILVQSIEVERVQ